MIYSRVLGIFYWTRWFRYWNVNAKWFFRVFFWRRVGLFCALDVSWNVPFYCRNRSSSVFFSLFYDDFFASFERVLPFMWFVCFSSRSRSFLLLLSCIIFCGSTQFVIVTQLNGAVFNCVPADVRTENHPIKNYLVNPGRHPSSKIVFFFKKGAKPGKNQVQPGFASTRSYLSETAVEWMKELIRFFICVFVCVSLCR